MKKAGGSLIEGFIKVFKNGDEVMEKAYRIGNYGHKGSKPYREVVGTMQQGGNFVAKSEDEALSFLKEAFPDIAEEESKKASKFGYRIDRPGQETGDKIRQGHQGTHINYFDKETGVKGSITIEE